jgi:hypothetical protein
VLSVPEKSHVVIHDSCMVRTDELADVLDDWVKKHYEHHPTYKDFGVGDSQVGALQYIAERMTRFNGCLVTSNYNKVYRVRKRRAIFTSLRTADEILTAMEEFWRLHTDIEIIEKRKGYSIA